MNELIKYLKDGKIIITPTDTIYGIMADACNDDAVQKVYEAKKRGYDKPLLMLVNGLEMLEQYVLPLDDLTKSLIKDYWPGPLTILFKKNDNVSKYVTNNEYVGIRYPDNDIIKEILDEFKKPVVSTSANISDSDVITEVSMVPDELLEKIDYVLDGGKLSNVSSTLIKIEDNKITILRDGILSDNIRNKFKDYMN
jgi:L-threonylcarbamoyladenylate synthase